MSDDDALGWAGDEKIETSPKAAVEPVETPTSDPEAGSRLTRPQVPAPLVVAYGVIAGVYLLYTAGWIITVLRSTVGPVDPFTDLMFHMGQYLAIASPAIWFGAVLLLTRGGRPARRILWLLVGLLVVIPWPTLMGV